MECTPSIESSIDRISVIMASVLMRLRLDGLGTTCQSRLLCALSRLLLTHSDSSCRERDLGRLREDEDISRDFLTPILLSFFLSRGLVVLLSEKTSSCHVLMGCGLKREKPKPSSYPIPPVYGVTRKKIYATCCITAHVGPVLAQRLLMPFLSCSRDLPFRSAV